MRYIFNVFVLLTLLGFANNISAQNQEETPIPSQGIIDKVQIRKYPLAAECIENANPRPPNEILERLKLHPYGEDIINKTDHSVVKRVLFDTRYWGSILAHGAFFCKKDNNGRKVIDNTNGGAWTENPYYLSFEFDKDNAICVIHIFQDGTSHRKWYYTKNVELDKIVVLSYDGTSFFITYEWNEHNGTGWYIYPTDEENLNMGILRYTSNKRIKDYALPDLIKKDLTFSVNINIANTHPITPQPIGRAELMAVKPRKIKKILTR
ncbi:MAG: hypothetical protein IKY76_07900 [Alistipes sp.]|nr:hypothetical protein [Alistipes sp.]